LAFCKSHSGRIFAPLFGGILGEDIGTVETGLWTQVAINTKEKTHNNKNSILVIDISVLEQR
jgi:hypothetical protein